MLVKIHCNPALSHQLDHGKAFIAGFRRHGIAASITHDPAESADVHIVSGPYFAKSKWLGHPNTILIDRCYYKGDPEHVSIGWMNAQGGRDFVAGAGREPPEIKANATGHKSIFLADYDGNIEYADTIRHHPAKAASNTGLIEALRQHRVAIGYNTTALVTAALEGLDIICKSDTNIMSRDNWLDLLPYADWSLAEVEAGDAWEHLRLSRNQL